MIHHYLKSTIRTMLRHRGFFALNLLGLTIGLMCAVVIFLYVTDELGFESVHSRANNIKRLAVEYFLPNDGGSEKMAAVGPPVGPLMMKDFPEVESFLRFSQRANTLLLRRDTQEEFFETITYADSTLFDFLDLSLVKGNIETALNAPMSMILTKDLATAIFGTHDVVGKTLELPYDSAQMVVTGVLDDLPRQSHLQFDAVASFSTLRTLGAYLNSWWSFGYHTYLRLHPDADMEEFQSKIKRYSARYIADQEEASGYHQEFFLQDFTSIHLRSHLRAEISANNKIENVYLFGIIGLFIVIIASINFMNLATARGIVRAREIGIRKVTGASRWQMVIQFLGESITLAVMALFLALVAMLLVLDPINYLLDKEFVMADVLDPDIIISFILISLVTGVLAGSYPAMVLSSYRPVDTLKGNFTNTSSGRILRKALVIFQFTISVSLIIGTIVVFRQLQYLKNMEVGFHKERTIVIPTNDSQTREVTKRKFSILKDRIETISSVRAVSLSSSVPGREMNNSVVRIGWENDAAWTDMRYLMADEDYLHLYDLSLVSGEAFTDDRRSEVSFIINESALDRFGYADANAAIGEKLKFWNINGQVTGVLKDFHFQSPARQIEPFILVNYDRQISFLSVSFGTDHIGQGLAQIEEIWHEVYPSRTFDYQFVDEQFERQFKAEERFQRLFLIAAIIAIVVACLGLFGLSLFSIQLKTKEIGIRKVLGATVPGIGISLTGKFLQPIIIALLIAFPLSWLAVDNWLDNFANRIAITSDVFIYGLIISLGVALITVSFIAVKAALGNPVLALKDE